MKHEYDPRRLDRRRAPPLRRGSDDLSFRGRIYGEVLEWIPTGSTTAARNRGSSRSGRAILHHAGRTTATFRASVLDHAIVLDVVLDARPGRIVSAASLAPATTQLVRVRPDAARRRIEERGVLDAAATDLVLSPTRRLAWRSRPGENVMNTIRITTLLALLSTVALAQKGRLYCFPPP